MSRPTVVIIGGGVSGLLAVRHLKDVADVVLYEARNSIGGLWSLDKESSVDRAEEGNLYHETYGCHFRKIHDDFVMNTPCIFSQLKDVPHANDCPSFLTREQFAEYIQGYADGFQLSDFVRLNTFVLEVRQTANLTPAEMGYYGANVTGSSKTFLVKTCSSGDKENILHMQADYVIVANGHNHVPNIPIWKDSSHFRGDIIHSRDFKKPNDPAYLNKSILVVGAGLSGYEMLVQFFDHPILGETDIKKMYFCGKTSLLAKTTDFMPWLDSGKLELIEGTVVSFCNNKVRFTNGLELSGIDTILLCTGYKFSFPFLEKEKFISLNEGDKFFGPLYKHTFCINSPHLCFVGNMDGTNLDFKITEFQCMMIKSHISGNITLCCKEEMTADMENDCKNKYSKPICGGGNTSRIFHSMCQLLPQLRKYEKFFNKLQEIANITLESFRYGNLRSLRSTEYREFFEDFEWDKV